MVVGEVEGAYALDGVLLKFAFVPVSVGEFEGAFAVEEVVLEGAVVEVVVPCKGTVTVFEAVEPFAFVGGGVGEANFGEGDGGRGGLDGGKEVVVDESEACVARSGEFVDVEIGVFANGGGEQVCTAEELVLI